MPVQDDPIAELALQPLPEVVAQSAHPVHRRKIARQLASFAEPDGKERTFGSGAPTALVPRTVDQRLEPHATANEKSADALGSVNLVTAIERRSTSSWSTLMADLAGRLSGVGVK